MNVLPHALVLLLAAKTNLQTILCGGKEKERKTERAKTETLTTIQKWNFIGYTLTKIYYFQLRLLDADVIFK